MTLTRVLIVEDDVLIALDVEQALVAAGFEICGVAGSEMEALALGALARPELAIVDISLGPGDGRVVARMLSSAYATAVLFATGQSDDIAGMLRAGALACLPKPYVADIVPAALAAVGRMSMGDRAAELPHPMFALKAA